MGDEAITEAVLKDHASAPISARMKAMLTYVKKVVHTPDALTAVDAEALRIAGVDRSAAAEALQVVYLFSVYNRLADTLHFRELDADGYRKGASVLLRLGYR